MLENEKVQVHNFFSALIHLKFHLYLIAVIIKLHHNKILYAAVKHHKLPHDYNYITIVLQHYLPYFIYRNPGSAGILHYISTICSHNE